MTRDPAALSDLCSERLSYEPLRYEQASEAIALLRDPRVWPWLWVRPEPPTEEDVRAGLRRQAAHWERHGFGMWLLRRRTTGEVVGRGGPQWAKVEGEEAVEVGWAIAPEHWGQGLATELAVQSVMVADAVLELPELIAFTLPDNFASRRVMEKAGFHYDRDIVHVGVPHVLYRIRLGSG